MLEKCGEIHRNHGIFLITTEEVNSKPRLIFEDDTKQISAFFWLETIKNATSPGADFYGDSLEGNSKDRFFHFSWIVSNGFSCSIDEPILCILLWIGSTNIFLGGRSVWKYP